MAPEVLPTATATSAASSESEGSTNNSSNVVTKFRIAVGSKNPCKINAVREAIQIVLKRTNNNVGIIKLDVQGYSSPSGVPDQPFGDAETQLGAKNRAKHAYGAYIDANGGIKPHLAVGLEGGLEWSTTIVDDDGNSTLWCMAWMAIYGERGSTSEFVFASKDCHGGDTNRIQNQQAPEFGLSKTGTFLLPTSLAKLIKDGMELGDADDKTFGRIKAKHGSGTVGLLTDGLIDRSAYYEHALVLAIIPWIRPDVYP